MIDGKRSMRNNLLHYLKEYLVSFFVYFVFLSSVPHTWIGTTHRNITRQHIFNKGIELVASSY